MTMQVSGYSPLSDALMAGYAKAAQALSVLVNENAEVHPKEDCLHGDEAQRFIRSGAFAHPARRMFSTALFGDMAGKSYLLLSEAEAAFCCRALPDTAANAGMHLEFLKDIDNIMSATIVTQLSNHLRLNILGDIPIDCGTISQSLYSQITAEYGHRATLSLSVAKFAFKKHPDIRPLMIWALCPMNIPAERRS